MTSVEKRRSGRKSGGHRKHSDGGYSDTSSCGSFLDETDREVSNLTDRAFRSLCIGDEAVYNDSDLCSSSPCTQRDRQLAFSQSGQDRDREDREREELKRSAHESFSLRMQQYGQDWIHGGMYGTEIHRDPEWEVYGERTRGRVSATFQHSFVETSKQEESLREDQLPFLSNGATELSSQQRRSRSRVSSLIRAFNSEGHRDGAGMDGKPREWNDESSWDKSALMSIQRELSEFSTSYQQNFNSGHFPSAGPLSSQEANFYSSEVAAVAHMNSATSFMRSSHSKQSMSAQVNCNSNFFIHSEFSPFKVWRDHNRFPFQQGQVSGFMHCSEFPKWYETPMYKELSLEAQPQGPYRFDERAIRHPRNNLAPVVPPTPSRSTSTSTMLQKALPVEKRCESELAGHYPHRKRMQSLGTNRLPSQRPSTASPTIEISRRVQDTISSVKALQQKIKMMTEQNITTGMTANQQGVLCSSDNLIPFGNNSKTVAPNVVSSNMSTTPFNISQLHTTLVPAHQEVETTVEARQYAVSPQLVEHPPVRAESRGATPDVRGSSYKSRATSLLFNLKDNRKRVKSTYSPTKFKGLETIERIKQPSIQEPRDTVIDIPDFPDLDIQLSQVEESSRINVASHQYLNQYHNPGTLNSQLATTYTGQYSEYTSSDYQQAQMQGEMVHHSGFTGFIPENYSSHQVANGQNLHEDLSSFTSYKQGMTDNVETLGADAYRFQPSYIVAETPRISADNNQTGQYLTSKANTEQHFNETVRREFTKVDRYQPLKDNKHDYSNVPSQDRWRQTNSQDTENLSLKAAISPWKQEITALMDKDQHVETYQKAASIKEEWKLPRDKYRGENQQSINKDPNRQRLDAETSSSKMAGLVNPNISNQLPQYAPFSHGTVENPAYYGQQQPGTFKDKNVLQQCYGDNKENEMKDNYLTQNYNRYTDQEHRNQQIFNVHRDKTMLMKETGHDIQSLQPIVAKPQFEQNVHKNSISNPDSGPAPTMENQVEKRQFVEVRAEQATAKHIKAQHTQPELAKSQHWAQVEQPKVESAKLILAGRTGSEKVKAEQDKAELTEQGNQVKAEHFKSREKDQSEQGRKILTNTEQTRSQEVTVEPKYITEEAEHMRELEGEQVKAEQAEVERLKEEHIKTKLTMAEQAGQARIKQAKTEQAKRERIKAEQLEEEQVGAEQVERERNEAEQIRAEKVKTEQAEAEGTKAEQAKLEQIKEQHAKTEQERSKTAEDESVQVGHINTEQHTTQIGKAKEEKTESTKAEPQMFEHAKVQPTKTEGMKERSAKPSSTVIQQLKSEPDKVEQVKTELAKAKAELAKIKEKMRGEQKEKARNTIRTTEDEIKKDVPLKVNIKKNEKHKDQESTTQLHQQREDSVAVSRQNTDQANRGADEYNHLREKYGFTDTDPTNRNKIMSAAGGVSSNDAKEMPASALDKVETMPNEKLKDKCSPTSGFTIANMEKKEVSSFKSNEVTESHYIYSETSKEFKLFGADHLPSNVDRGNSDTATDKLKDDSVEKLEKCGPLKHTDVSQQTDTDLAKPLPPERKPKSTEHSAGPGKDLHFTPSKALSHKERAQTKQEILTSKIKAHAEKEISAIKEKGFAIRDGFISKNSTKHLTGSQSISIRQRPPSHEVPKNQESTMSSNTTLQHQIRPEPSGTQMESVKSLSHPSSATIPLKSTSISSQLDHSQKQGSKEPMKSIDNVTTVKPLCDTKQTPSFTISTDGGLVENQKKENHTGMKSPMQSNDQRDKNKQGQQAKHEEISGNQNERPKENPAVNTEHVNVKKQDPSQAPALVKAESSKPLKIEKAGSKHEAVHEVSAPLINLVFGQNETPVSDDSLQITGIMVTVRERKPSVDNGQQNNSIQEVMNAKEKECTNSEPDKCHPSSGPEDNKENGSSTEVNRVKAKDRVVQNTAKEDQTKVSMNNQQHVQEISTLETSQSNAPENVTVNRINLQQSSSSTNAKPQRETQLQETLTGSTVTVPAKNKESAETQPLLYKQDMIARDTNKIPNGNSTKNIKKDEAKKNVEEKSQTTHINENLMPKMVNTGVTYMDDSNRVPVETLLKHGSLPTLREDMTTVINPSESRSIDGSEPQLKEKKCETTPKPFNITYTSNHLTGNESKHVSPKPDYKETQTVNNNQVENNVHIGSIAIRVVPAVTEKDNLETLEKHRVTPVSSDVASERKQGASSNREEKVNTFNNEDRTKDLTPASSEKQMEDKLGAEYVLSSVKKLPDSLKISNQQNNISMASENGKSEKDYKSGKSTDESKPQPTEGDYFQVQGIAKTNDESDNSGNAGTSDVVSKGGQLSGLQLNNAANESYSDGKLGVLDLLDQSKMKTVESSAASVQDEKIKRQHREAENYVASKHGDGPTERQANKNEKTEADQTIHIRKQHTENQCILSARERQNSGNLPSTGENIIKEKTEVKPKPKERASTIPEISAIADYARLKVIVSDDKANTIQEFPPNKKEGFFPLIQTRHSRRPVFTADPQDLPVKEKCLPNKTEVSSKVNKEPKPLVFPITEKEHLKTGMFKLGDKERQEKLLVDVRANADVLQTGEKHAEHLKERKAPTTNLKNQRSEEQVAGTDAQRVHQKGQSIHQPNNLSMKATTSSSTVNMPRSSSEMHLMPIDSNSNPHEKTEKIPYLNKNVHPQPESLRKDEKNEDALVRIGEDEPIKLREDRLATLHEENTAKQMREKQLGEAWKMEKGAEDLKIKHMIEESRASLAEEERRVAQREEERRAREREAIAVKIKERREKLKDLERRAEEERRAKQTKEGRVAQTEEEIRAKQREEERRMKETEERRRVKMEEERGAKLREEDKRIKQKEERTTHEKMQRTAEQEAQQRRAAQEQEEDTRAVQEEQQRKAAQKEEQRRSAQEEQQKRAAQEQEQHRRAAKEEQQRRAAQEERQKRAAQQERQMRAAQEQEQQRRTAQEQEQQRRAAHEQEQQRRAAQEQEQQRRTAQEQEQQRRAAHEQEQQRRAAQEQEQQRRAAQEQEQQRRAAQEQEQQRRAAQEQEQQRRAAQEQEQQRRAAQEQEQQRRAAQEQEQQRRAAQEQEQQRRSAQEKQQRRTEQEEEQQRRAAQEEERRRATQEAQRRRAAVIKEQRQADESILADIGNENKIKHREKEKAAQIPEEERIQKAVEQKKAQHLTEEQRVERQKREELMRTQKEEEERRAVQKEKTMRKEREEKHAKEVSHAALIEGETRVAQEEMIPHSENEIRAKKREEEEKSAAYREKERLAQMEEQKRTAQKMDALQYYAITSKEMERKPRERQLCSPLPSQRRSNPSGLESTEDSHNRPYRPHAPASPAPSLPRSNASSPALGAKPLMFRVKDNTIRGSSFTKSVKPRFHKNFGEDFRVGSPMGSERGEEEQETIRRSAVTPLQADTGLNRLAAIKESSTFQPSSSSQDYSAPLTHQRPYWRRSIALDEDDSRSVISNMSEDVESFATSAADLAELRGLYDFDRPESACSFSSDVSRSLGKPPVVPPKSEKALRRAQRLTTRRIKKELSKGVADSSAGVEKPLQEVSSNASFSSTEVHSSNHHAVASPHFSPPVSLAHAPALESGLPSPHKEHHSSHSSLYASPHVTSPISLPTASPHATAPVSLPTASRHATAPVSLPIASPHTTGPASYPAVPKTVADVPSSPSLHHANHPSPVTQYHVESNYPQFYPLTQRKVLQDLGSGQYFVVDVPVQVKTKTFFDPETGKYVQLNVRESAKSASRPQPQQTYLQPQHQPQIHGKPQQPLSQDSPAGKPFMLYQSYHGYPHGYQPTAINPVTPNRSSAVTLHQDQHPAREGHSYGYPAPELGQNSEGHRYSPEKTPYMDTVNDTDKTYNRVYNTHGSYEHFPECDTNSQLAGSSVCENENSAHSRFQPRDIITMSELDDFMELSDW